ncbi:DUF1254 domain-containing protein [Sinorhizobium sp. BG8]|uniref:DUF1254 domain-containing protein n=1 Tax=Sinorhizobium sp. BG8 TaxID=2613773 RepID=UPI00193E096B|nr:DUF1254 domain-containing protein [Sinorhizobium sp. BG8]QRM55094.1 DUF1254 domain-containing protein [Sinorhizobium sp. BG8]
MKTKSTDHLEVSRRDLMKGGAASLATIGTGAALPVAATGASLMASAAPVIAQETSESGVKLAITTAEVKPLESYVRSLARSAYIWGWPMVNMYNRRARITQAPHPGLLGGVLPVAPRGQIGMLHDYIEPSERAIACPNQDVVYGQGFFDLDTEPVVVQVPDFGDRFWVYAAYDHRTDQYGRIGKAYGTKPGFYLLAGPNWKGGVPNGIADVVRASTTLANIIPRIFMNDTDEDRAAIQPLINQIVVYPLTEFTGEMKTIEWSKAKDIPNPDQQGGGGETHWVVPEKFFDQFPEVLDMVPPQPGEEAMYAQFRWLNEVAAADPAVKKAIVEEAAATEKDVIVHFREWATNGKPAGNGWNRSMNNAEFGLDYYNRVATSKSNMFENRPNETQYFYTDFDSSGTQLQGGKTYSITFAKGEEPPVNGFWSMTLYNEEHFFHPNALKRYSLGTKNTSLKRNADGSLTLYAGSKNPGGDKEGNWLPAPEGTFSLYIRAYWGKEPIIDGSWQPPKIEMADL